MPVSRPTGREQRTADLGVVGEEARSIGGGITREAARMRRKTSLAEAS